MVPRLQIIGSDGRLLAKVMDLTEIHMPTQPGMRGLFMSGLFQKLYFARSKIRSFMWQYDPGSDESTYLYMLVQTLDELSADCVQRSRTIER